MTARMNHILSNPLPLGLISLILVLLLSAPIAVIADMDLPSNGETLMGEDADAESAPDEELEALKEQRAALLAELAAVRRDIFHLRRSIEAEDEQARELVHEMNELRRTLREKNAELEEVIGEQEEFRKLNEREMNQIRAIQEIGKQIEEIKEAREPHAESTTFSNHP